MAGVLYEEHVKHRPMTDEEIRQETIKRYKLGGVGREPLFDNVAQLAASFFDVPTSVVTILNSETQQFRGACGIANDMTDRESAFCNHTVEQDGVFIVNDASIDPRFNKNRLVTGEPGIRFYAGAPIRVSDGIAVGSLCLIDYKPREFLPEAARRLEMLAGTVADLMELRLGSLLSEQRGRQLERQTDLLRATIDNVEQGIALFDGQLRLVLWNDQFFDLLEYAPKQKKEGIAAAELLRIAVEHGYFGPGDPATVTDQLLHSISSTPSRRLELDLPSGSVLRVWRAALPHDRSIITVENITEARANSRYKDQFVATVSHELRTPLTSILGSLALLDRGLRGKLDTRNEQMLSISRKNAERLGRLIDDVLDFEKLGNSEVSFIKELVSLRDLALQGAEQNVPYATTLQVRIETSVPADAIMVMGDPDRLLQALSNLLSNACKFSSPGGVVFLKVERGYADAKISVTDNGPGIPTAEQPRLFKRFSQVGTTHQRGLAGTGLGLAITRSIVERHGGTISVDSIEGEGSTFWFSIPLSTADG